MGGLGARTSPLSVLAWVPGMGLDTRGGGQAPGGALACVHTWPPFSQREAPPIVFFLLFEVVAGCEEKIAFVA